MQSGVQARALDITEAQGSLSPTISTGHRALTTCQRLCKSTLSNTSQCPYLHFIGKEVGVLEWHHLAQSSKDRGSRAKTEPGSV